MTAREEILARIQAIRSVQAAHPSVLHRRIQRGYSHYGKLSQDACVELFISHLSDYDAEILQVENGDHLASAIAEALRNASEECAVVAPAVPVDWLPLGFTFRVDDHLAIDLIENTQAVLTTCQAAVASTGTIVLVHNADQARRVLTLLPDHHICLVRRNQIFELLPEALEAVARSAAYPITMISGPSATSDIEMIRVRGVHGPRRLTIILYGALPSST